MNKKNQDKIVKDVQATRAKLYQQTKNMSISEQTRHTNNSTEKIIKEFNLKTINRL